MLDTDTVVSRNLERMWHEGFARFGPQQVLMAKKLEGVVSPHPECRDWNRTSINSGVMLYNLTRMRQTRWVVHSVRSDWLVGAPIACLVDALLLCLTCLLSLHPTGGLTSC